MEVHAHTHSSRKRWTHYLWEFLMLFLAVFCGFLAENQREHMIEHKREKQFMKSMMEDLKLDTSEIRNFHSILDTLLPVLRKSADFLFSGYYPDSTAKKMYEIVPRSPRFLTIAFEDRTTVQLKNSGTLRLIRNKELNDSLVSYWKSIDHLVNLLLAGYEKSRIIVKDMSYSLFNSDCYKEHNPYLPLVENVSPKLIVIDPALFIKMGNYISNMYNQATREIKPKVTEANQKAITLIDLIKKKYHFE